MADATHLCEHCGAAMAPMKRPGNPKRFCSETCRNRFRREDPDAAARMRQAAKKRREAAAAAHELTLPPRPECRNCGKAMRRRAVNVYCDAQPCRTAKYHARQASRPRCSNPSCDSPVIVKGLCGSHYAAVWRAANVERSRDNRKRRRARERGARVEDFTSTEVYERDNWIGGICSEPIPRDAVWPDLRSPSVDHVVPLSRGGEHSMRNVQASHLSCNSRKQASVPVEAVAS